MKPLFWEEQYPEAVHVGNAIANDIMQRFRLLGRKLHAPLNPNMPRWEVEDRAWLAREYSVNCRFGKRRILWRQVNPTRAITEAEARKILADYGLTIEQFIAVKTRI